jgi:hypothetical protein
VDLEDKREAIGKQNRSSKESDAPETGVPIPMSSLGWKRSEPGVNNVE